MKESRTNRNIRFTDAEWETFRLELGTEWLRAQIARARAKAEKRMSAKAAK